MQKTLPRRTVKKVGKHEYQMSEHARRKQERFQRDIMWIADKSARDDVKVQHAALKAIADTLGDWLAHLEAHDPARLEEFFFEVACFASGPNRRRMFKHAVMPEGTEYRVQEQVDQWQAQAEVEKAAAEKAKQEKGGDGLLGSDA